MNLKLKAYYFSGIVFLLSATVLVVGALLESQIIVWSAIAGAAIGETIFGFSLFWKGK